jgi:uncharacterized membrane protein YczE
MMIRRFTQLQLGLILYGFSMALMIRAGLGLNPWDVFHQGVAANTGWSVGTVVMAVGAGVLLLWVPLRQRPGIGTISNILVIGLSVDACLAVIPEIHGLPLRASLLGLGIFLNGVAGGAYIGAGLGPGPRDGLMTGLVARTGGSVRKVRTGIEIVVVAIGWLLGGTAGLGTILYALAIGPLVQAMLPIFTIRERRPVEACVAAE